MNKQNLENVVSSKELFNEPTDVCGHSCSHDGACYNVHIENFTGTLNCYCCCCDCCSGTNPCEPEDPDNYTGEVIGICLETPGNTKGVWTRCDINGQPVKPVAGYFDNHAIYKAMQPVVIDGQHMVENKPFWVKHLIPTTGRLAGRLCRILSPVEREGFHLHPAFKAADGSTVEKLYISAYQGSKENSTPIKLASVPGVGYYTGLSSNKYKELCENRNTDEITGYRMWDIHHYSALCLLFLIEFEASDSQALMPSNPHWRNYYDLHGKLQGVDGFSSDANHNIKMYKNDGSCTWIDVNAKLPTERVGYSFVIDTQSGSGDGYFLEDSFIPGKISANKAEGSFTDSIYIMSNPNDMTFIIGGTSVSGADGGLFYMAMSRKRDEAVPAMSTRLVKVQ